MKKIRTGSDFSGVGAFDIAIERIARSKGFKHQRVYACDFDKYARKTYIHNHGEPNYYPENVYNRDIPEESLDIYMTSPPCQSFSSSGLRGGKGDERGLLFFNSHEFIKKNKPRYFIFENVRGLIHDDKGQTFKEWVSYLGGKSVNGIPVLFKDKNAVDYHVYYKVINSSNHGVPQSRERIFIIGIRDDQDNKFDFPKDEPINKTLQDVLEHNVNEKYFLKEKMLKYVTTPSGNDWKSGKMDTDLIIARPVVATCFKMHRADTDNYVTQNEKLRRLTPRECFRLQDFPDHFDISAVSDTQGYKQAGNSITVRVLEKILSNLKLT